MTPHGSIRFSGCDDALVTVRELDVIEATEAGLRRTRHRARRLPEGSVSPDHERRASCRGKSCRSVAARCQSSHVQEIKSSCSDCAARCRGSRPCLYTFNLLKNQAITQIGVIFAGPLAALS